MIEQRLCLRIEEERAFFTQHRFSNILQMKSSTGLFDNRSIPNDEQRGIREKNSSILREESIEEMSRRTEGMIDDELSGVC